MFWNEIESYNSFIPAWETMVQQMDFKIQFPFPKIVGGAAVDFKKLDGKHSVQLRFSIFYLQISILIKIILF